MDDNHFTEKQFLQPTINAVKKSIRGIDDSYSNYWDILAELVQNSVDAIRLAGRTRGDIRIEIDQNKKTIKVADNGIGIKSDEIPVLLSPFSTNKEDNFDTIGEKGVGLKFVIFQGNYFELTTKHMSEQSTTRTIIKDAKHWLESDTEDYITLKTAVMDDISLDGTEVFIECSQTDDDNENDSYLTLFKMNIAQLAFVLRTKTAIGNLKTIMGNDDIQMNVSLKLIDRDNKSYEKNIPFSYWLPVESLNKNDICDLDEFINWSVSADHTDIEKKNYLSNKAIIKKGQKKISGRSIDYWSCYLPSRRLWREISERDELISKDDFTEELEGLGFVNSTHQSGIYIAVKGMPTGISIEHPSTGVSGYWENMFIIFDDNDIKFDIGRKSVSGNNKKIYRHFARELFKEYTKYIGKYAAGDVDLGANDPWDRDKIRDEIMSYPDLVLPRDSKIKFGKIPSDQEASVAAIFYELISTGELSFVPLLSGYRNKYDLYAKLNDRFSIIEFKSHLKNIVKDFDDEVKMFTEIDYVVCWDVNDEDKKILNEKGITLEKIEHDSFFGNNEIERESKSTHKLISNTGGVKPIYVIDLKMLLDAS